MGYIVVNGCHINTDKIVMWFYVEQGDSMGWGGQPAPMSGIFISLGDNNGFFFHTFEFTRDELEELFEELIDKGKKQK